MFQYVHPALSSWVQSQTCSFGFTRQQHMGQQAAVLLGCAALPQAGRKDRKVEKIFLPEVIFMSHWILCMSA